MSYQEQAEKINTMLKEGFEQQITKETIINAMLYFGQVAKFRCRNNSAYDNFARECLKGIAEIERVVPEGLQFEVLRVKK